MISTRDIEIGDTVEVTIHEGFNCTPRNVIAEVVNLNFNGVFVSFEDVEKKFIHKGNVLRVVDKKC